MNGSHQFTALALAGGLLLACAASSNAQSSATRVLNGPGKSAAQKSQPVDEAARLREDFVRATEDYKASLKELMASHEREVQKRSEHAAKLKELYNDGLISRRELEESESGIAQARMQVEESRQALAAAELAIEEARRQPVFQPYTPPAETVWQDNNWTTGNARFDALIRQNGARHGVDPYLIYCVMQQESHFNQYIVSPKGATGLMQLMPGTAVRYGVSNPYDAAQNINAGTRYLKELMQMFGGRVELVLASYNAGEGAVIKFGQRIPPYRETLDYVRLISARYFRRVR